MYQRSTEWVRVYTVCTFNKFHTLRTASATSICCSSNPAAEKAERAESRSEKNRSGGGSVCMYCMDIQYDNTQYMERHSDYADFPNHLGYFSCTYTLDLEGTSTVPKQYKSLLVHRAIALRTGVEPDGYRAEPYLSWEAAVFYCMIQI